MELRPFLRRRVLLGHAHAPVAHLLLRVDKALRERLGSVAAETKDLFTKEAMAKRFAGCLSIHLTPEHGL